MGHDEFHKSYIRFVDLIQEREMGRRQDGGHEAVAESVIEQRRAVPNPEPFRSDGIGTGL